MSLQPFFHAIQVDTQVCFGCTHCMMKCPTDAIRIDSGKAHIRQNWCVDCGECIKACPVGAIYIEQENFDNIFAYKYRVMLLPSVFIGQFSKYIKEEEIVAVIQELGFTHVFQVEQSVPTILSAMQQMAETQSEKPLISPFCPAIVRLIQIKFPSLVENIVNVKPPIDATAILYRSILEGQGLSADEVGVFYVTPCAAKIAAVKAPVGQIGSPVNGVINMDFLYNKVLHLFKQKPDSSRGKNVDIPKVTATGLLWSLTHGEANHMNGRCLAIDDIKNVIEFLDRLETTDEIQNVDFLELRACDQSCAGGILLNGNRFLTVERLKKRAELLSDTPYFSTVSEKKAVECLEQNIYFDAILPKSMQPFGSNKSEALKMMELSQNLMNYLPGIDCGACGAPSCQALADDVARKEAHLSHCVFLQRTMEQKHKLSSDYANRLIEKTWGKDRFDKDYSKIGTKNEG